MKGNNEARILRLLQDNPKTKFRIVDIMNRLGICRFSVDYCLNILRLNKEVNFEKYKDEKHSGIKYWHKEEW